MAVLGDVLLRNAGDCGRSLPDATRPPFQAYQDSWADSWLLAERIDSPGEQTSIQPSPNVFLADSYKSALDIDS